MPVIGFLYVLSSSSQKVRVRVRVRVRVWNRVRLQYFSYDTSYQFLIYFSPLLHRRLGLGLGVRLRCQLLVSYMFSPLLHRRLGLGLGLGLGCGIGLDYNTSPMTPAISFLYTSLLFFTEG